MIQFNFIENILLIIKKEFFQEKNYGDKYFDIKNLLLGCSLSEINGYGFLL